MKGRPAQDFIHFYNAAAFSDYINARKKLYSAEVVERLMFSIETLMTEAKKKLSDFTCDHGISVYEDDEPTITPEQLAELQQIRYGDFKRLNEQATRVPGLKTKFKNAEIQKRHKKKHKHTDNDKKVIELERNEHTFFLQVRSLCKEKEISLTDALSTLAYAIKHDTDISITK